MEIVYLLFWEQTKDPNLGVLIHLFYFVFLLSEKPSDLTWYLFVCLALPEINPVASHMLGKHTNPKL